MSDSKTREHALYAAAQGSAVAIPSELVSPYTFGRTIKVSDPAEPSATTTTLAKRQVRPRVVRERVRVMPTATGRGTLENHRWLRENEADYRGQWVALRCGILVDSDAQRIVLHNRLKAAGTLAKELLFVKVW